MGRGEMAAKQIGENIFFAREIAKEERKGNERGN